MYDTSIKVFSVMTRKMHSYVHQNDDTVRVFLNQPQRVELQLRNPKWYSTVSLSANEAKALIAALEVGLREIAT